MRTYISILPIPLHCNIGVWHAIALLYGIMCALTQFSTFVASEYAWKDPLALKKR